MTDQAVPFNPLDKKNLGASVAEALLTKEVHPLAELPVFKGAGIYAIYYTGNFPAYQQLARLNRDEKFRLPIYVGKGAPAGARKGTSPNLAIGRALHKRLKEHVDSIKAVENLRIQDFYCRFLVVDDIWIPLGESLVIARYAPVWNAVIEGFGNHNPGKGRYEGKRPLWDVLHPGRGWVMKLVERTETAVQIAQMARSHLKTPPACLSGSVRKDLDRVSQEG